MIDLGIVSRVEQGDGSIIAEGAQLCEQRVVF